MAAVLDNFLEGMDWREVDRDSYRVSDSEVLGVDCLGTCMGLAAFDSGKDTGYLFHARTLNKDDEFNENLEGDVESFLDELDDSRPYEVLAGGTIDARYNTLADKDFTSEARKVVEEALQERNFDYEASWNDLPVYNRMIVSPQHGILYDRPE